MTLYQYYKFSTLLKQGTNIEQLALDFGISLAIAKDLSKVPTCGTIKEATRILYLAGVTNTRDIAIILYSTENTIGSYIYQLKNEGMLPTSISKTKKAQKLIKQGIVDIKKLQEATGLSKSTLEKYISIERRAGNIAESDPSSQETESDIDGLPKPLKEVNMQEVKEVASRFSSKDSEEIEQLQSKNPYSNVEYRTKDLANSVGISLDMASKILQLLSKKYPIEIASTLKISPHIVYQLLDNMNPVEKTKRIYEFSEHTTVFNQIMEIRKLPKGSSLRSLIIAEVMQEGLGLLEFADIYYILGMQSHSLRVLNKILYSDSHDVLKSMAVRKKDILQKEFQNQTIREEYTTGSNMNQLKAKYGEYPVSQALGPDRDRLTLDR